MKVAVGADHYGYPLKLVVVRWLAEHGHEVVDVGCHEFQPDEKIADYADAVSSAVANGGVERGILLCMSGGAMCIRANRWPGVRAVLASETLEHDREASDVNVLGIAAYYESWESLVEKLAIFFETPFEALERRVKRLARLDEPVGV